MSSHDTFFREVEAFSRHWKKAEPASFGELADMLTATVQLKRRAAETALTMPRGFERGLVMRARGYLIGTERRLRRRIKAEGYTSGVG